MRQYLIIYFMIFLLNFGSGCGSDANRLIFHAGAGQRSSLDECAMRFCKQSPKVKVDFCYKGSGYFLSDIEVSKTGDLYMPGEEFYMLQAVERGHIQDYDPKKDIVAYFATVIIVPRGNPKNITSVQDFARPGVRVGLGDKHACAIGVWHEKIFRKAGIWETVKKNATMNAKCIPELGNACQLRAIDATIVWTPLAVLYLNDIDIIPTHYKYRGLIRLPIGSVVYSKNPGQAQKLKEFILSDTGRTIFRNHAYIIDPDPMDKDYFCLDGRKTDQAIRWMVEAVKVCRNKKIEVNEKTVGFMVGEVLRQRERRR